MSVSPVRILLSTNEVSADENCAHMVVFLQKRFPGRFEFTAIGGNRLREQGVSILEDISTESRIGSIESVPAILPTFGMIRRLKRLFQTKKPPFDLIFCVDGQGRNILIGKLARSLGIKTAYYFPPLVFVWNEGDKKAIKKYFDIVFCPFEENVAVYKDLQVPATTVGHPFSLIDTNLKTNLKKELQIPTDHKLISLFPGSRYQEINGLTPIFLDTIRSFLKQHPSTSFVIALSHRDYEPKIRALLQKKRLNLPILYDKTYEILKSSDFSWMSSGSATVLAGFFGVPHAICYRISGITYFVGQFLVKYPFIGMLNILSKHLICQEFINQNLHPKALCLYTESVLYDSKAYRNIQQKLKQAVQPLQKKHPYEVIGQEIIKLFS